jgi:hypothetical protein
MRATGVSAVLGPAGVRKEPLGVYNRHLKTLPRTSLLERRGRCPKQDMACLGVLREKL